MSRQRIQQATTLEERLTEEARRFRREARGTPPGIERERLIRKARQAETASHLTKWLHSRR
nr:hypothetical protein [Bradyrhizobium sp. NAS80.1]